MGIKHATSCRDCNQSPTQPTRGAKETDRLTSASILVSSQQSNARTRIMCPWSCIATSSMCGFSSFSHARRSCAGMGGGRSAAAARAAGASPRTFAPHKPSRRADASTPGRDETSGNAASRTCGGGASNGVPHKRTVQVQIQTQYVFAHARAPKRKYTHVHSPMRAPRAPWARARARPSRARRARSPTARAGRAQCRASSCPRAGRARRQGKLRCPAAQPAPRRGSRPGCGAAS